MLYCKVVAPFYRKSLIPKFFICLVSIDLQQLSLVQIIFVRAHKSCLAKFAICSCIHKVIANFSKAENMVIVSYPVILISG